MKSKNTKQNKAAAGEAASLATIRRRFMRTGAVQAALAILIAVFATLFAYELPFSVDLTAQNVFTLSDASRETLASLSEPVRVAAVYPDNNADPMIATLLREYAAQSGKIELQFVDAQSDPSALSSYNLGTAQTITNGTLIFNCGERVKILNTKEMYVNGPEGNVFYGERSITGAIRYVSAKQLAKLYFITGHGELSIGDDLLSAADLLRMEAYETQELVLLQQNAIPDDASAVIFAAPVTDLTPQERTVMETYLAKGGRMLLMLNPALNAQQSDVLPNFRALANSYGVELLNNYVVEEDQSYYLSVNQLYLIPRYTAHEITTPLAEAKKLVILPITQAFSQLAEVPDGVKAEPLLMTSDKSWARLDMTLDVKQKTPSDIPGLLAIAYAAQKDPQTMGGRATKAVFIGDSDFIAEGNLTAQANADFFSNVIHWLTEESEGGLIPGKVINADTLMIRAGDFVKLSVIVCGIVPLLMFAGALMVWYLRRNR
jgi:ABC-2 type transport system permease protein